MGERNSAINSVCALFGFLLLLFLLRLETKETSIASLPSFGRSVVGLEFPLRVPFAWLFSGFVGCPPTSHKLRSEANEWPAICSRCYISARFKRAEEGIQTSLSLL